MRSDVPRGGEVRLRDVVEDDLPCFFEFHCDPEAVRVAVFPPRERDAFMMHWRVNVLGAASVVKKAIVIGEADEERVAGYVVVHEDDDRWKVGYWLGRAFWGRGFATSALAVLLEQLPVRPIEAWVAASNAGSIRVLEKCGFRLLRSHREPASDGGEPLDECVFKLDR